MATHHPYTLDADNPIERLRHYLAIACPSRGYRDEHPCDAAIRLLVRDEHELLSNIQRRRQLGAERDRLAIERDQLVIERDDLEHERNELAEQLRVAEHPAEADRPDRDVSR